MKIIIDTDGVIDDCRAISLALQTKHAEVIAISTVDGCISTDQAVANVSRTIRANNIKNLIPIYKGASESFITDEFLPHNESSFFGKDGIGDSQHIHPQSLESDYDNYDKETPAAIALTKYCSQYPGEITIVALGPLTNIALAIKLDKHFKNNVKQLYCMGGNVYGIGNIDANQTAEYNFGHDPEAAHIVLNDIKCPITIVPWECFYFESNKGQHEVDFHSHLNINTNLSKYFKAITSLGRKVLEKSNRQYAFCDEIVVASLLYPERIISKMQRLKGTVELHGNHTRGQIAIDWISPLWEGKGQIERRKNMNPHKRPITFITEYNSKELTVIFEEIVKYSNNDDY
uniref:IU_nuc_hydro domain-containing protein n=1 Tax=Parastrongyloides trichosuri TaxID=131310 RepID=A0A0N4ZW77_PARTI